eukprot:gene4458-8881_t
MSPSFGCLQILSTAAQLPVLQSTISSYLNDMLIIDKLQAFVYGKTIFKDSEQTATEALRLLLQFFQFDNTSIKRLIGIPFGVIIGRLLKFFPNSPDIPHYGRELLYLINKVHLDDIFIELYNELNTALAANDDTLFERILDAIAGFTLIAEGRALCLSSGITSLLLQTAIYTDRKITERSMAILLNITTDFELSKHFAKEKEVLTTAFDVLSKYVAESIRPAPEDTTRIITQSIRLMNTIGQLMQHETETETDNRNTSKSIRKDLGGVAIGGGVVGVGSTTGSTATTASSSSVEDDTMSHVWTAAAELMLQRSDLLSSSLSEAYLEFMWHAMRRDSSLCLKRSHIRSIGCAVTASATVDESPANRKKTLHSCVLLFEEIGKQLANATPSKRKETLDALKSTAPTLAALLATDLSAESTTTASGAGATATDSDVMSDVDTEAILVAITGLVRGADTSGIDFIKELLEYLPSRKSIQRRRLSVVLSELESSMSTEGIERVPSGYSDLHLDEDDVEKLDEFELQPGSVADDMMTGDRGSETYHMLSSDNNTSGTNTNTIASSSNNLFPLEVATVENHGNRRSWPFSKGQNILEQLEGVRKSPLGDMGVHGIGSSSGNSGNEHLLLTSRDDMLLTLNLDGNSGTGMDDNSTAWRDDIDIDVNNSNTRHRHHSYSDMNSRNSLRIGSPAVPDNSKRKTLKACAQLVQHINFHKEQIISMTTPSKPILMSMSSENSPTAGGGGGGGGSSRYNRTRTGTGTGTTSTISVAGDVLTRTLSVEVEVEELSLVPDLGLLKQQAGLYSSKILRTIDGISEFIRLELSQRTSNFSQLERHYEVLQEFKINIFEAEFMRDADQDSIIMSELINCLQDALRCLDDVSTQLSFYNWQDKEQSLLYHLELTMSMLKGEIFSLTHAGMEEYMKIIDAVSKSEQYCDAMFKTAHLEIKRVVMDLAGEQKWDSRWTLQDEMLEE